MQKKYFLTNSMLGISSKSYLLPSFFLIILGNNIVNPYMPNGIFNPWQLDEPISSFKNSCKQTV